MEKQNLFTEEELAKVTDEAERKHLIECAQDQSKIDMKYMEIMNKYDLWEKGEHSRYFHATTHENAEKIMQDEMIIRPQDDIEMSDEDAMRMQMAMSAMKDKSMTQRIEG